MPRHTEKAHETLGLTGETQIVALADFHGRFDNHHQPWWVWALTGQARINQSGLAAVITHWFVSFSTPGTYSWIVYLFTGVMDFFVPSGGSKFVIEAPYLIPAGKELGIPVPHIINAYSTGAQWANLIQPFWALPMLAAFRLRFQDILPFTFIYWLFAFVVSTAAFLLFPQGF